MADQTFTCPSSGENISFHPETRFKAKSSYIEDYEVQSFTHNQTRDRAWCWLYERLRNNKIIYINGLWKVTNPQETDPNIVQRSYKELPKDVTFVVWRRAPGPGPLRQWRTMKLDINKENPEIREFSRKSEVISYVYDCILEDCPDNPSL